MKDLLAAVGSTLPAWSMARTSKPCAPSDSVSVVRGDVQAANGAVSTRHSKLAPASFAEKANVGVESFVVPVGPDSIDVCGGVPSARIVTLVAPNCVLPCESCASVRIPYR